VFYVNDVVYEWLNLVTGSNSLPVDDSTLLQHIHVVGPSSIIAHPYLPLFHSWLKTYPFHKSFPVVSLLPSGLPSWTIAIATRFLFLVSPSVRPQKVSSILTKFGMCLEVDECCMTVCSMTRSKLESRKFGHFQRLSPPPFTMGAGKWPRILKLGHNN